MLRSEHSIRTTGIVIIMSDLALLIASTKTTILQIAQQSNALANGLQNVAPGTKTGVANNSVQYLFGITDDLIKIADRCEELLSNISRSGSESSTRS